MVSVRRLIKVSFGHIERRGFSCLRARLRGSKNVARKSACLLEHPGLEDGKFQKK